MISRDQLVDDLTRAHHSSSYLAEVVSVDDPDGLSRVEVRLLSYDGVEDQSAPIFARVAVPFASARSTRSNSRVRSKRYGIRS